MNLIATLITRPDRLYWWQWGQVLGVLLPVLLLSLGSNHLLLWALATHFLIDFTAQSPDTSVGKAQGNRRILALHAFISGGYPGLILGGLPGLVISVVIHFLVDTTNKFGLDEPAGPALDQVAHLMTLAAIWWLF